MCPARCRVWSAPAAPGGTRRRHGLDGGSASGSWSEDYDGSWEEAAVAGQAGGLVFQPSAVSAAGRSFSAPRLAAEWLWQPAVVWLLASIYFLLLLLPPPSPRGLLTPLPW